VQAAQGLVTQAVGLARTPTQVAQVQPVVAATNPIGSVNTITSQYGNAASAAGASQSLNTPKAAVTSPIAGTPGKATPAQIKAKIPSATPAQISNAEKYA
jgi:hypothetical protein